MKRKKRYGFQKLRIWQEAKRLAGDIYRITSNFPESEKFGLVNQLRRAIVSVSSNIAEGATRFSKKEQARFTEVAYGSLAEVVSQLEISSDLDWITEEQSEELIDRCFILSKQISRYRSSILAGINPNR